VSEELPEGWASVRLADVGEWGSGGTPRRARAEFFTGGTIPWLKIGDLTDSRVAQAEERITEAGLAACPAKLLDPGTLLIAMYGSIGKLGVTEIRCATNQAIAFCRPRIDLWYLFWALRWSRDALEELGKGGMQANISQTVLKNFEIPIAPLAEQRRIVAKVEALLAQVNAARERLAKVPSIVKRFRQAVLAAACSGRLTQDWRTNRADSLQPASALVETIQAARRQQLGSKSGTRVGMAPTLRTDLELYDLPHEWIWVDLRFLMNPQEAFCYGVVQPGEDRKDGIPLIRAGDLHSLDEALPLLRRIPRSVDERYERSRLRGGELLVTVVGANIGTVAIAPEAARGFNIARAVAKVPVSEVSSQYVLLWLQSATALSWMVEDAREVARPTLNLEQLETLPVPLPPLEEQREIVKRVTAMLGVRDAAQSCIALAERRASLLPNAILSKAFSGELVPTEADVARIEGREYEPASRLIERIRASGGHPTDGAKRPRRSPVRPKPASRRSGTSVAQRRHRTGIGERHA
jgi:type I restriction enzyme S subunit